MIGKLTGLISAVNDDKLIIDVNGVGYVVFVSKKTADFLKKLPADKTYSLTIETLVKEDSIELYGFISEIEKNLVLELTKVQGVGAKMGQKILSAFSIEELAKALIASDVKAFSQISGIGPKLAARLTTELKDSPKKLGIDIAFDINANANYENISKNQIAADALSALENLGYRKADCLKIIDYFLSQNNEITLENLITLSLREMSKNKF